MFIKQNEIVHFFPLMKLAFRSRYILLPRRNNLPVIFVTFINNYLFAWRKNVSNYRLYNFGKCGVKEIKPSLASVSSHSLRLVESYVCFGQDEWIWFHYCRVVTLVDEDGDDAFKSFNTKIIRTIIIVMIIIQIIIIKSIVYPSLSLFLSCKLPFKSNHYS